jgi:hypothetical protein
VPAKDRRKREWATGSIEDVDQAPAARRVPLADGAHACLGRGVQLA